jgi:hypothetical protein
MLNADPVGRYRVEDASPTGGAVMDTVGKVATGVVAGTPGMDADPVGRDRAEDAHPTDLEGEVANLLAKYKARRIAPTSRSCQGYWRKSQPELGSFSIIPCRRCAASVSQTSAMSWSCFFCCGFFVSAAI